MWLVMAVLSAFFAGIASVLAKCGIKKTDSDVATAIRTIVVLAFSCIMVAIVGSFNTIKNVTPKSLVFLILSGVATGASWLCYYYAIQSGIVSVVVPIDKLSVLIAVGFSIVVFKEKLSVKAAVGLAIMTIATVAMAIWA